MTRTPSKSHSLAMRAAAAIAAQDDEDEGHEQPSADVEHLEAPAAEAVRPEGPVLVVSPTGTASTIEPASTVTPVKRGRGRPKSKRPVEARHTVYLDDPRHSALKRLAEDRGRSIHSLILEGIDHVIGKPQSPGWQGK